MIADLNAGGENPEHSPSSAKSSPTSEEAPAPPSAAYVSPLLATPRVQETSEGVLRVEQLSRGIGNKHRWMLYGSFALLAFALSLDQYTSGTYLATATSLSFEAHSVLATINTIKAVFQSVSQPPIAKISDVFGRIEAYCFAVILYVLGYLIVSFSGSIYVYALGASINVIGITGLFLLQEIIIADISSLRNRLFWSIFPSLPGAINVWISGNVAEAVLNTPGTWRLGYGLSTALVPVLATPIIITLALSQRDARRSSESERDVRKKKESSMEELAVPQLEVGRSWQTAVVDNFWQLDVVGLLLLVVSAGLVLTTVTIANGNGSNWNDARYIVMLVFGGLAGVGFVVWEKFLAKHPLIPFKLLKNRTVLAGFSIALWHPMAGGLASNYFFTFLSVAANQSTISATRITGLNAFSSILTAVLAGVLVRYTRHLKPLIIIGTCFDILGIGLMIKFRQADNTQGELAISQIIRGVGEGLIGFPVQAAVQSMTKHEHVAAITGAYLTIYYLSSGIGSAISGGIWTNLLPPALELYLGNSTLAETAYTDPFGFAATYAFGSPEREAVGRAYSEAQRTILIVATAIAVLGFISAFFLHNTRLTDEQSLDSAETESVSDERTLDGGEDEKR